MRSEFRSAGQVQWVYCNNTVTETRIIIITSSTIGYRLLFLREPYVLLINRPIAI